MQTAVRSFTDQELLDRVKGLESYNGIPEGFWLIAVRSEENIPNRFDDKFYLFKGPKFLKVWKGTTNAGLSGLKAPMNAFGCAVVKSDEIYYDAWARGLHHQKVWAYIQVKPIKVYRDNDRDDYAEEIGPIYVGMYAINIHPADYTKGSRKEREFIGPWSAGCLVFAVRADEDEFMTITQGQKFMTVALLKEWS